MLPPVDRTRLPEALRNVRLEHLSSGALMLLDHNGDLVRPPSLQAKSTSSTQPAAAAAAVSVTLDPRVNGNLRLGNDPPALPSNMRAQAEPHIARSQVNSDILVATFQEGRFTDGGGVDCGYSLTTDGGVNWTRALIPRLTNASGGPYFRATDPVAGIDLSGNIFLNTEGATDSNFNNGDIVVSRSTDGGVTFGAPAIVYHPTSTSLFPDKPWMAVNTFPTTTTVGRIVVTFTLFSNTSVEGGVIERGISTDGGVTWGTVGSIGASATNAQGSQPVFLPNGNFVVAYWNFNSPTRLEAVISTDGGATFGTAHLITTATEYDEPSIRSGGFLPSMVSDRTTGNLYLVYQTTLGGSPRIAFTKSTNGGLNWTPPIAISDNPAGLGVFNPAVNVSPDGQRVTVVFYDHRNNPGSSVLVDLYLAQSFDGGATWQPNIRLTSTSTDASLAPLTSAGYMLGDYQGVAETTNTNVPAVPVWIDTRTGNPDPFIARIGIAPQLNFDSWQAARLSLGQINDPVRGGKTGDADGDGKTNLMEYALGTSPLTPDTAAATLTQIGATTSVTFPRLKAATDVSLHAYRSTDLTPASWTQTGVTERLLSDDGTIQLWQASTPSGFEMFMRLQAQ